MVLYVVDASKRRRARPWVGSGRAWDANDWLTSLSVVGGLCQAFNPDLSELKARGAKLILWNGTKGTAISPRDTARYYKRVVEMMGRDGADQTVELFLAPASATVLVARDPTRSTS
jgi:tannase/feruloyl esterase